MEQVNLRIGAPDPCSCNDPILWRLRLMPPVARRVMPFTGTLPVAITTSAHAAFRSPVGRVVALSPAAALKSGPDVSITVRPDAKVKTAIPSIPDDAWITIE